MVEPEVSARVLETLARREVSVEFTIGTDGAVSEIKVSLPGPRPLVASITAALEQWRFEAQRAPRAHKVLLVFSPDR